MGKASEQKMIPRDRMRLSGDLSKIDNFICSFYSIFFKNQKKKEGKPFDIYLSQHMNRVPLAVFIIEDDRENNTITGKM